ncbi:MAG TPA: GntR family transcriptional regulator [Allosphingosinicella sp.]|nr:GntR family transcriptional regulator [Allosphingosinicella sp.]
MNPGPTFERVYRALKEQLMGGFFAPGDPLEPAMIGAELNASVTPVRDALHRLVGERMVDAPRNDGFRSPAPTEAELRDLYGWRETLLELALRRSARRSDLPAFLAEHASLPSTDGAAALFVEVARRTANPEHERAVAAVNDRLSSYRAPEGRLFEDLVAELSGLRAAFEANDDSELRRLIFAYHRRRRNETPHLLLAARMPRSADDANNP